MYDAMLSTADSTDTDWMLSVYDTISYFADELVLRLAPDRQLSFHSADDVRQGISNLIQDVPEDEVHVGIMVCPPTFITLVFTNGTMYILDSHRHVAHGAAIIVPGCCLSAVQLANHLIRYLSASEVYELDLGDCHLAMLELN